MKPKSTQPNIFSILKPYTSWVVLLTFFTLSANGLTLWVPKLISHAIDSYVHQALSLQSLAIQLSIVSIGIFLFTYLQNIIQVITAERVARDLRNKLAEKISQSSFAFVQEMTSAKLLTNITSDMDGVKSFVAQAVAALISSIFLILGASVLLLQTNWRLGLAVLTTVPIIAFIFFRTLKKVREFFIKGREIVDRLNRVINESILGAALVRVFNSQSYENAKFVVANAESRDLGLQIVKIFSGLIPLITFVANAAALIILVLGGHYIINGSFTLGDFAAFNTYMTILIFPIFMIGFTSNIIAQASASYGRIAAVLDAPIAPAGGSLKHQLNGDISVEAVSVVFNDKNALNEVSFTIPAGKRTAIIGPTAAGKTQLIYALIGLIEPTRGKILYDGRKLNKYDRESFYRQIGAVFQDSVVFNMSLKENIAFTQDVSEDDLQKAIRTAELEDFINTLPHKLETIVSERGTSLSGGQKQRLMLARALAQNPRILFLDDFTARVDTATEKKIIANLKENYPELTLISVTQKIGSIEAYEQIIVLMEGELLASGTHKELMKRSPEYVQIFNSQKSTNNYELQA